MGKISPVSSKYIVHAKIDIDGVVDKPDVIGAIFGQTEGLLGSELELRELQRSGRIGRIEVNVDTRSGKTQGAIVVPSSLDKAETAIIGAALEIIQRIGPCNANIKVNQIEDVRISKRNFVVSRAKELLQEMMDTVLPDSQELADEVASSVRAMEIEEYGKDRLPAGPAITESDEIIVVEGRADVITLLKNGIKNAISLNGTSVPQTIIELCQKKIVTAFVDGDRGGELIVKELSGVTDIDYVARAPDGKEVEELTKKEIHKGLRSRMSVEQALSELSRAPDRGRRAQQPQQERRQQPPIQKAEHRDPREQRPDQRDHTKPQQPAKKEVQLSDSERLKFAELLDDLIGTRGAYILDEKLNILGKVPTTELQITIKSLKSGVYAIILDGVVEKELVDTAEDVKVSYLVAMDSRVSAGSTPVVILTSESL